MDGRENSPPSAKKGMYMPFWDTVWDVFCEDCLLLLPILFLTFFLIEYVEHRAGEKFVSTLRRSRRTGPLWGALLGCVPQCSFSVSCAHLYNEGIVTAGTLIAVFLSTSDEAIPVLLSQPNAWSLIGKLLLCKVLIACAAGFLLDFFYKQERQQADFEKLHVEHTCHAKKTDIKELLWESCKHTLEVWCVLFLVTLGLTFLMGMVPRESLQKFLLDGFFQPFLAGLLGLIPNCAVSVVLVELYLSELISFGSMTAGLCTSAGLGLLVLFKGKRGMKNGVLILGITYLAAVIAGTLLQLFIP